MQLLWIALLSCLCCCSLGLDSLEASESRNETAQNDTVPYVKLTRVSDGVPQAQPLPDDPKLMALSEDLYSLDQQNNAASINHDWTADTRSKNGRLLTILDKEQKIFKKPTYAALIALLDNYNPLLGVAEVVTPQEKKEESTFLDLVIATPVMKKAWEFLQSRNLAPKSAADFKALLQRLWFTLYKRRGQFDTSGFEHVFVGEIKDGGPDSLVDGLHNWVQYAREEAAGRASYVKWKGQSDPDLYGMQFSWNGHNKIKSTLAIGESPEMSMAILTVCSLVAPDNTCKLRMGGAPVSIISYRWTTRNPDEFYVASAYYDN